MHAETIDSLLSHQHGGESEKRRQRALQVIYELRFTFDMEELARQFLQQYVSHTCAPDSKAGDSESLITDRVLHRV